MIGEDKTPGGGLVYEDDNMFPVGLRVLAVDDDPLCLKVLENLLHKCQYKVTTTNQAITALKLLRENKSKYDVVISDVNMPEMDGFKLLEHVGIEMDIPVIMLSGHSDKELVYKGVSHGAVDYLLKPVRIEELKNIWQHVVRKRNLHCKFNDRTPTLENSMGSSDDQDQSEIEKNQKRRKQDQDEENEASDEDNKNESGTQKKPRVVWSVELHKKFLAAVNQLGYDMAVPKKILDLMKEDGITRENVASHLQKYRQYLKKCPTVESQQANTVHAFGGNDPSYLRLGLPDRFQDFRTLKESGGRFPSNSTCSNEMLGRLNSRTGLTLSGITTSNLHQPSHAQSLSDRVNLLRNIQPSLSPLNQVTHFNSNDQISGFTQSMGTFTNQPLVHRPGLNNSQLSAVGFGRGSSHLFDNTRGNGDTWQGWVSLPRFPPSSLPPSEPSVAISQDQLIGNNCNSFDGMDSLVPRNGGVNLFDSGDLPMFDPKSNASENFLSSELREPQNDFFVQNSGNYDALDDIMEAMIRQDQDGSGFGLDASPLDPLEN